MERRRREGGDLIDLAWCVIYVLVTAAGTLWFFDVVMLWG